MNWDYDKLFAVGNVVGVKSNSSDTFLTSAVDYDNIKDWKSTYGNEKLSNGVGDILWIVRLNENGEVAERVFDRERDMLKQMPELEDGMFVEIYTDFDREGGRNPQIGVIVNNHVVYEDGGWDCVCTTDEDDVTKYITKVWDKSHNSFCVCHAYKPDWEK